MDAVSTSIAAGAITLGITLVKVIDRVTNGKTQLDPMIAAKFDRMIEQNQENGAKLDRLAEQNQENGAKLERIVEVNRENTALQRKAHAQLINMQRDHTQQQQQLDRIERTVFPQRSISQ